MMTSTIWIKSNLFSFYSVAELNLDSPKTKIFLGSYDRWSLERVHTFVSARRREKRTFQQPWNAFQCFDVSELLPQHSIQTRWLPENNKLTSYRHRSIDDVKPNLEVVRYSLETAMSNAASMTHRSLHQNRFHTHNQLSLLSYFPASLDNVALLSMRKLFWKYSAAIFMENLFSLLVFPSCRVGNLNNKHDIIEMEGKRREEGLEQPTLSLLNKHNL